MRKLQVLLIFLSCFGAVGASADEAERTVALLLAAPGVAALSELAGKNVAIDEATAASHDEAQHKVEATVNAKLAGGRVKALDRLVSGEVPAAVLTLDYPETAEWSAEIAGFKVFRIPLSERPQMAEVTPAAPAAPVAPVVPAARAEPAAPAVTDSQPASAPLPTTVLEAQAELIDPAAVAAAKKVREQMRVATVVAEHVMTLRDADKKAVSSPNGGEPSVAIVVAKPEIKSVSDLTGKIIAIDDKYSNANARIHDAIASAGASDSLLASSERTAMDRLLSGKTPAAVLTLVYPETGFSTIEGYSVFRVPLAAIQPSR
jgi:ABC-type phosphate/phosphonate transport system substrate-binding protein